jgi:hypothetical protein
METQEQKRAAFMQTLDAGIDDSTPVEEDERRLFSVVRNYFLEYGRVPSLEVVLFESNMDLPEAPEDPLEYWIDETLNQKIGSILLRAAGDATDSVRAQDIPSAITCIGEAYSEVTSFTSRAQAVHWIPHIPEEREAHRQRQLGMIDPGITTGISYLDAVTLGAQPGDNWALVGRPEVGKSFFLSRFLLHPFLQGLRVLVYSMEMPKDQWCRRNTCLATNLSTTLLRAGRLSFLGVNKIQEFYDQMTSAGWAENYRVVEGRLEMSTSDVLMEMLRYRPHIVGIDGAYLLKSFDRKQRHAARWERAMTVMEDVRKIAMQTGTPMIATYQFGRGGEKKGLEGIAGTDAIGQLNSIVLGIYNEIDSTPNSDDSVIPLVQYKVLEFIKGREGEKGKVRMIYDMRRTRIELDRILKRVGGTAENFFGEAYVDSDGGSGGESLDEIFS